MFLEEYNVSQLKEKCKQLGIKTSSTLKKNELIKHIKNYTSIGIHVFKKKNMLNNIKHIRETLNVNAIQIFTHGPRNLKPVIMDYVKIKNECKDINIYVHSAYMINPWKNTIQSMNDTVEEFKSSYKLGSKGVVLHIPKITPENVVKPIPHLINALKKLKILKGQKIILEMKAVKSDPLTSYETPEKINRLVKLLENESISPTDVGICIDTAHIYASNATIFTYEQVITYCNKIEKPEWITLLHLNGNEYDVKKRSGDKHAIPFDKLDKIWGGINYNKSGCKAFIEWTLHLNIDIILEAKDHHSIDDVRKFMSRINLSTS
jgi:endonuclease IV